MSSLTAESEQITNLKQTMTLKCQLPVIITKGDIEGQLFNVFTCLTETSFKSIMCTLNIRPDGVQWVEFKTGFYLILCICWCLPLYICSLQFPAEKTSLKPFPCLRLYYKSAPEVAAWDAVDDCSVSVTSHLSCQRLRCLLFNRSHTPYYEDKIH